MISFFEKSGRKKKKTANSQEKNKDKQLIISMFFLLDKWNNKTREII